MGTRGRGGLVALAVLIGSAGLGGVAEADGVACGQVITENVVLDADVGPCSGPGLVIGAANITVDLGGHKVFGAPSTSAPGVLIERPFSGNPGNAGVRVRNGTITGFRLGVSIVRSFENTVERLRIIGNSCHGIELQGIGGGPFPAADNTIRENVISRNGCAGIHLFAASRRNTVERNAVTHNADSGIAFGATGPNNSPRLNTVQGNLIHRNGADGVTERGLFNALIGNTISANRANGVRLISDAISGEARVEGNVLVGNHQNGVLIERPRGGNHVRGNTAFGNGRGAAAHPGTTAGFDLADENRCGWNTWVGNRFATRNQPCIH